MDGFFWEGGEGIGPTEPAGPGIHHVTSPQPAWRSLPLTVPHSTLRLGPTHLGLPSTMNSIIHHGLQLSACAYKHHPAT